MQALFKLFCCIFGTKNIQSMLINLLSGFAVSWYLIIIISFFFAFILLKLHLSLLIMHRFFREYKRMNAKSCTLIYFRVLAIPHDIIALLHFFFSSCCFFFCLVSLLFTKFIHNEWITISDYALNGYIFSILNWNINCAYRKMKEGERAKHENKLFWINKKKIHEFWCLTFRSVFVFVRVPCVCVWPSTLWLIHNFI